MKSPHPGGTNRREFLRVSLAAGGSLALGFALPVGAEPSRPAGEARDEPAAQISIWLKVRRDGRITFVNPHAEMGQGIWSSLAMVFVDEFGGDWATTDIEAGGVRPEFRLNPYVHEVFTAGSSSIATGYLPVRTAAAAAREMFLAAGAARLGTNAAQLSLAQSRVHASDGRSVGIGELLDEVMRLEPPANPTLKSDSQLQYIGKGIVSKEILAKVTGRATYGIDVQIPGMLIATVKASPVHGGRVVSSNAREVGRLRGVRAVVPIAGGLAVVADTFWHAKRAADALKIDFDPGTAAAVSDESIYASHQAALQRTDGVVGLDEGDARRRLAQGGDLYEAAYYAPRLAHATMEPMSCTARVTADGVDLWLGTQGIEYVTNEVARLVGTTPDRVRVHNLMLGGGFGRRYEADYPSQAVTIAQALPGTAVKLIWTREEDMQQDFYRPASAALLRATLGAEGLPKALLVRVSAPAIAAHNPGFAQFSKPVDITAIDGFATLHYEIPHRRFEWLQTESHVRIGWWRSVGNSQNAFFKECFIDELATHAGADPIDYRLRLLSGDRHRNTRRLLTELARVARWGQAPAGRYQGLALHETFGTMVGQIAEISLEGGELRVHRITAAYDCGSIVNPSAVEAQLHGGMVFGLTATLFGEINIERGRVRQSNFHDYQLVRLAQMPDIELVPVLRGGPPSGVGEPGVPPVAPAIANALFRASGRRVRRLPLTREGVAIAAARG